mgnify:CR=1 FL=1
MEPRELTREDIDKVRGLEGFPAGSDEDIINLSDAPYYTACPNPFIKDFVERYGKSYDEETDEYNCEPFASDVSEGKSDPIYMAHSYHTKVPYRAIKKYIMHYTKPGDIVLDAYCGTGMTGVAAQACKSSDEPLSLFGVKSENEGARKVILNDLSPVATFISYNCNREADSVGLRDEIEDWLNKASNSVGWVYKTNHASNQMGTISYSVWSQTVICPHCGKSMLFYDLTTAPGVKAKDREVKCLHCGMKADKADFIKSTTPIYDDMCGEQVDRIERHPIKIFYSFGGKIYEKKPDQDDLQLLEKIEETRCKWYPTEKMMFKGTEWGEFWRAGYHTGITRVHHFYSKRNLIVLSELFDTAKNYKYCSIMRELIIASLPRASIRNRFMPEYATRHVGTLSGTLYVPPMFEENNLIEAIRGRSKKILTACAGLACKNDDYIISTGSITQLPIDDNCVDYVFTDPPFGNNLIYSELNFISESWLGVYTDSVPESIVSTSQNKDVDDYKELMKKGFAEYYRVLKPNRWITVEFHNSQNAVWNAIQEAIQAAGFIIADVRVLDKKKGTTKQLSYAMAVKQDLVISAYKPKNNFRKALTERAGTEETAWMFVHQHLEKMNPVILKDGRIEVASERQAFLLFDRMVAYHVMNGIPVPLDAVDFYRGLDERFLKRDGMYFLSDQVNEYDSARIKNDVEAIQFSLFVTNEKTAIAWLYQQLSEPQTYSELQPKFMQEVKSVDRYEDMPELAVLLEENFLQDEKGRWYIPDVTKEGDVAKLREKKLWKEFEGYLNSKGKLKLFRSEAIRVGFSRLWKDKNYQAIVDIAERLPEQTIQEDPNLLMYYDISLSRV